MEKHLEGTFKRMPVLLSFLGLSILFLMTVLTAVRNSQPVNTTGQAKEITNNVDLPSSFGETVFIDNIKNPSSYVVSQLNSTVRSQQVRTLEGFFKLTGTGPTTLFLLQNDTAWYGGTVRLEATPIESNFNLSLIFDRPSLGRNIAYSRELLAPNTWHHIAVTYRSNDEEISVRFFINGHLASSITQEDGASPLVAPKIIYLGAAGPNSPTFSGMIDEFRLSDVDRYPNGSYIVPNAPFTSDANTRLLMHFDGNLNDASGRTAPAQGIGTIQYQTSNIPNFSLTPTPLASKSTIYENLMPVNGWNITSTDANMFLADKTQLHSSPYTIRLNFPYPEDVGVVFMSKPQSLDTSNYHQLQFYVRAESTAIGGNIIAVEVSTQRGSWYDLGDYIEGRIIPVGQWKKVNIPLGDWHVGNQQFEYIRFLHDYNPTSYFYIDDMKLVCQGDTDGDGSINEVDREKLNSEINRCNRNCRADFDRSGSVTLADASILNSKFGQTCE